MKIKRIQYINIKELTILPELENFIPDRTEEQRIKLRKLLTDHGQQDAIIITDTDEHENLLVDGHGRIEVLKELGKDQVIYDKRDFENMNAIKQFMYEQQIGRRNLSENALSSWRAKIWMDEKQTDSSRSKKEVAASFGIEERTLTNDMKLRKASILLEKNIPGSEDFTRSDTTPKGALINIAEISKKDTAWAAELIKIVQEGDTKRDKVKRYTKATKKKESDSFNKEVSLKRVSWKIKSSLVEKIEIALKDEALKPAEFVEDAIQFYLDNKFKINDK